MLLPVSSAQHGPAVMWSLTVATLLAGVSSGQEPARKPSVKDLAAAKFERVAGPATGGAVLDVDGPGGWCSVAVGSPTVDFDGRLYRMWFVGSTTTADPGARYGEYDRIGLATSRDGLKWELANDGKAVLDLGPEGSFDAKGLAHPFVMRIDGEFWMWYGGIDGRQAGQVGVRPHHVRIEQVGLARSPDGIRWKRSSEPVMKIGPTGSIDSVQASGMHVLRKGDEFWMWYGAYNGKHTLALAKSPDGVHWEKANDGRPVEGLGGTEQLCPSVYFDGQQFFLLYNHSWNKGWTLFSAVSDDGIRWTPANAGQPVLGPAPQGGFAAVGPEPGRNFAVAPSQILFDGGSARAWYGAEADAPLRKNGIQRIGLMAAPLR